LVLGVGDENKWDYKSHSALWRVGGKNEWDCKSHSALWLTNNAGRV
jgi:hypothetical protein